MSTVVLTPTHMACDHTVVHRGYPNETVTDLNHNKIFIHPSKKIIIGVVGEFIPSQVSSELTMTCLAQIFVKIISDQAAFGLVNGRTLLRDDDDIMSHYETVFGRVGHVFLASRHYRFLVGYKRGDPGRWFAARVGPYCGIGTGGMTAAGMLQAGMPLHNMWPHLHRLDPHSSVEYTAIPLKSLKPSATITKTLKNIQERVGEGKDPAGETK